jgi:hypothetical protein
MTRHRLTALLALAMLALAVTAGSALAGGDHGKGGTNGNSANAPGQLKQQSTAQSTAQPAAAPAAASKHESKQSSTSASAPATGGSNANGVKPSNTTKHDTYAVASSDQTKSYGNGKTAGQIATSAGFGGATLHGPGNSQPHKAMCGGHEVDVHALAHKGSKCGTAAPVKPAVVTPSAVTPAAPTVTKTAVVTETVTKPVVVVTQAAVHPAKASPKAAPKAAVAAGKVKGAHVTLKPAKPTAAGAVLGKTTRLGSPAGSSSLPFTGLPLWIFALLAAGLLGIGLATRHASNRI